MSSPSADNNIAPRKLIFSYLQLWLVAILWGGAFVPQRLAMVHTGPFTFNAIRFICGGILVGLFLGRRRFSLIDRAQVRACVLLGGLLFIGATFQQIGMVSTTAGKGGFITGIYIVLVPILASRIWRDRVAWNCWLGACGAIVGLGMLSLQSDFSIAAGDIWIFACAITFAFHVIAAGRLSAKGDPLVLAVGQYFVCGILSIAPSIMLEQAMWPTTYKAVPALLYIIIFSTGIGYTFQLVAQRYVPATNAAIIVSLESVFAALAGAVLLNEHLSSRQLAGCAFMVLSTVFAQLPMPRKAISTASPSKANNVS